MPDVTIDFRERLIRPNVEAFMKITAGDVRPTLIANVNLYAFRATLEP